MAHRTAKLAGLALPADLGGVFVNLLLRLLSLAFTVDSLLNAADERFAGKALGPRNLIILFGKGAHGHGLGGPGARSCLPNSVASSRT